MTAVANPPIPTAIINPLDMGAKGDGKTVADGTIAAGSLGTLTSATAAFTQVDVGKVISVGGAGPAGERLLTTIQSVTNGTTIQLAAAATAAVAGASTFYGTDDTVALQAALDTALHIALPGNRTYLTTAALTMTKTGTRLAGPRSATLKRVGATALVSVTAARCELVGFTLDGNSALKQNVSGLANTGSHTSMDDLGVFNVSGHGIMNGPCDNAKIRNCEIGNIANGIGISQNQSVDATIVGNHIWATGLEGITIDVTNWRSIIHANRIADSCRLGGAGAISLDQGDLTNIVGNYIEGVGSGAAGIIANNNLAGGVSWVTVIGNIIINAAGSAVRLRNNGGNICDHWIVANNVTRSTGGSPIVAIEAGCTNCIEYGNVGT